MEQIEGCRATILLTPGGTTSSRKWRSLRLQAHRMCTGRRLGTFYTRPPLPFLSVNYPPSDRPWVWVQVKKQQKMTSGQFKSQEVFPGKVLGQWVEGPRGHQLQEAQGLRGTLWGLCSHRYQCSFWRGCDWTTAGGSQPVKGLAFPFHRASCALVFCLKHLSPCSSHPSGDSLVTPHRPSQAVRPKQVSPFFSSLSL